MNIYSGIYETNNAVKQGITTIGVFDSMHIGHQKLITDLVNKSKELNFDNYIVTFRLSPRKNSPLKVLNLDDKLKMLEELNVSNVILCDFDEHFSSITPEDFLTNLYRNYNIIKYYIGVDFRFGLSKLGSSKTIAEMGFEVFTEPTMLLKDRKVSTSEIKECIASGLIEDANNLLGRTFFIKGIVRKGKQLGRKIGFPTMNISNDELIYPQNGAFITTTEVGGMEYYSMTYVDNSIIETHLLNYDKYDYNFMIKIKFFKKIRNNVKFSNLENLTKQLENDLTEIKKYFNITY